MLKISVGGGLEINGLLVQALVKLKHFRPNWFYSDISVSSIYDSFYGLCWNGGRIIGRKPIISWETMLNQVEFFNSRGIGVYFTFSNNILTPHHLQDEICNRVLKMFENPLNGVIISSPILYEHVKKIAPKYKTIFSLTNVVYDKNRLLNIANDYDLIVIPPEFNTDIAFLKQFPPEKIELVINESCVPYCKYKKEHYTFFAKKYLGLLKSERAYICRHNFERETMVLSMKNMREIMIATNISCFKLVSRVPYYEAIKIFSTYFVKEEYAETFCIYMKGLCLNSKT